jgi:hypothetical protein
MASKGDATQVDRNVTEPTAIIQQTPVQRMIRTMELEATADAETSANDNADLNALLTAETDEELWDADERPPLNAQHLAGCDIQFIDVRVKYSRGNLVGNDGKTAQPTFVTTDGKKMYLLVTAVRLSDPDTKTAVQLPAIGEEFEFNTSARYLTTKLFQFYLRGKINRDNGQRLTAFIRATGLEEGQAVLKLRPPRTVRTIDS